MGVHSRNDNSAREPGAAQGGRREAPRLELEHVLHLDAQIRLRDDGVGKSLPWSPMDIEDLHKEAQRKQLCPYFNQKDRLAGADLIFMPYNYLIDSGIRENFNISFANTIIIFDEAHNIA